MYKNIRNELYYNDDNKKVAKGMHATTVNTSIITRLLWSILVFYINNSMHHMHVRTL